MRGILVALLLFAGFLSTIAHKHYSVDSVLDIIQSHPECSSIGTPVEAIECGEQTACDFPNEICVAVEDEKVSHDHHNMPSETIAVSKKQRPMKKASHEAKESKHRLAKLEKKKQSAEQATYEATQPEKEVGKARRTSHKSVSAPKTEHKSKESPSKTNSSRNAAKTSKDAAHEATSSRKKSHNGKKKSEEVDAASKKETNDEEVYGEAETADKPKKNVPKVSTPAKETTTHQVLTTPKKKHQTKTASHEAVSSTKKNQGTTKVSHKQDETPANDPENSYHTQSAATTNNDSKPSQKVASKSQKAKVASHEPVNTHKDAKPKTKIASKATTNSAKKASHEVEKVSLSTKKTSHKDKESQAEPKSQEVKYVKGEGTTADEVDGKIPPLTRDGSHHELQLPDPETDVKEQYSPITHSVESKINTALTVQDEDAAVGVFDAVIILPMMCLREMAVVDVLMSKVKGTVPLNAGQNVINQKSHQNRPAFLV
uniref:Uncharacterized protein n=1 Tax=Plectus sambesii TaxID=2011161 RepID=A0A914VMT4_9BILA